MFKSFLKKFAGEYRLIGSALGSLIAGVALQPAEAAKAREAVDTILGAAENIEKSLKTMKDISAPTQAQVTAAVKQALPDIIGGLSEAALRELLEKKTAK
jgi:hypothetical protein